MKLWPSERCLRGHVVQIVGGTLSSGQLKFIVCYSESRQKCYETSIRDKTDSCYADETERR